MRIAAARIHGMDGDVLVSEGVRLPDAALALDLRHRRLFHLLVRVPELQLGDCFTVGNKGGGVGGDGDFFVIIRIKSQISRIVLGVSGNSYPVYCIPADRVFKISILQVRTSVKCIVRNKHDTFRNCHGRQRGTTHERLVLNAFQSDRQMHTGKTGAIVESAVGYNRDAVAQYHPAQALATIENMNSYACDSIRQNNFGQPGTAIKSIRANTDQPVRQGQGDQPGAVVERIAADFGHTGRNRNGFQSGAIIESVSTDAGHAAVVRDDAVGTAVQQGAVHQVDKAAAPEGKIGVLSVNRERTDAVATAENAAADRGRALPDVEGLQTGQIRKGISADALHAVRQGDGGQRGAGLKRVAADTPETGRQIQRSQPGTALESGIADGLHGRAEGQADKYLVAGEGAVADGCNAVTEADPHESRTVFKGLPVNGLHTVRNRHVHKAGAAFESTGADHLHAVPDCDLDQTGAVFKHAAVAVVAGFAAQLRNTAAQYSRCDRCASIECAVSDADHTVGNCHRGKSCTICESIRANGCHRIRNDCGREQRTFVKGAPPNRCQPFVERQILQQLAP